MKRRLIFKGQGQKTYAIVFDKIAVNEQVEVLSWVGGQILEAHVWPTLEVVIEESPKY